MNKSLLSFVMPALLLLAAAVLPLLAGHIDPEQRRLLLYAPGLVLAVTALLALHFNHGRVVFVVLMLGVDYLYSFGPADDTWESRMACLAISGFTFLNIALFAWLKERGLLNGHGLLRLVLLGAEALAAYLMIHRAPGALLQFMMQPWIGAPLGATVRLSLLALLLLALGALAIGVRMVRQPNPVDSSFLGALLATAIALAASGHSRVTTAFFAAAGLMLAFGILRASWYMAYRDELTGIPSRRALNEHLMRLGRRYVIAMLDVDHFKSFNTQYGHETGDQVLKMVARHIVDVKGGGKAYRYGGEEFTIIFPRRHIEDAVQHLEALCAEIAAYPFAIRKPGGRRLHKRGDGSEETTQVTISIGVAERNDELKTPEDVLQAADQALYRAKDGGRNQVSR
jgi:diguanylate cyclase (GGDEF)-like protein